MFLTLAVFLKLYHSGASFTAGYFVTTVLIASQKSY